MAITPLKAQILAELDQLPEDALAEILAFIQTQKPAAIGQSESPFMQGYQRSKQKRREVYRRLADS
jgi:predicted transposase YdaD